MGGPGSGIISKWNYPRKRLPHVPLYVRLLERIRTETKVIIPFGARIERIYRTADSPPDMFKWIVYSKDGELTIPRVGSPVTGTQLMKYKRLTALQSKDGKTIEIWGAGQKRKARPRGIQHWGEITGALGKNYEVSATESSGGIVTELRGKRIGVRTRIMYDEVSKEDVLTVELTMDGKVVECEIYRYVDLARKESSNG